MSLLVTPRLGLSTILRLKRLGLGIFFLPVFFTLYKLAQAGTRQRKQTVIRLMSHTLANILPDFRRFIGFFNRPGILGNPVTVQIVACDVQRTVQMRQRSNHVCP